MRFHQHAPRLPTAAVPGTQVGLGVYTILDVHLHAIAARSEGVECHQCAPFVCPGWQTAVLVDDVCANLAHVVYAAVQHLSARDERILHKPLRVHPALRRIPIERRRLDIPGILHNLKHLVPVHAAARRAPRIRVLPLRADEVLAVEAHLRPDGVAVPTDIHLFEHLLEGRLVQLLVQRGLQVRNLRDRQSRDVALRQRAVPRHPSVAVHRHLGVRPRRAHRGEAQRPACGERSAARQPGARVDGHGLQGELPRCPRLRGVALQRGDVRGLGVVVGGEVLGQRGFVQPGGGGVGVDPLRPVPRQYLPVLRVADVHVAEVDEGGCACDGGAGFGVVALGAHPAVGVQGQLGAYGIAVAADVDLLEQLLEVRRVHLRVQRGLQSRNLADGQRGDVPCGEAVVPRHPPVGVHRHLGVRPRRAHRGEAQRPACGERSAARQPGARVDGHGLQGELPRCPRLRGVALQRGDVRGLGVVVGGEVLGQRGFVQPGGGGVGVDPLRPVPRQYLPVLRVADVHVAEVDEGGCACDGGAGFGVVALGGEVTVGVQAELDAHGGDDGLHVVDVHLRAVLAFRGEEAGEEVGGDVAAHRYGDFLLGGVILQLLVQHSFGDGIPIA